MADLAAASMEEVNSEIRIGFGTTLCL